MANSTLTPEVAGIHFDDLEQLFRLKITFQVQTPLGNFQREVELTASTLAAIITQIINIWGAIGSESGADHLNYAPGEMGALGDELKALAFPPTLLLVPPVPPAPDDTTDPTWGTYDGTIGHLAGTDWGRSPPA